MSEKSGLMPRLAAVGAILFSIYILAPKNSSSLININIGNHKIEGQENRPFEGIYITWGERGIIIANVDNSDPVVVQAVNDLSTNGDPMLLYMKMKEFPTIYQNAPEFVQKVNDVVDSGTYARQEWANNPGGDPGEIFRPHVIAREELAMFFRDHGDLRATFGVISEILASHDPFNLSLHQERIRIARLLQEAGDPLFTEDLILSLIGIMATVPES